MSKRPELTHYEIAPRVTAFSTTRHGGVGEGNYSEFNINPYCGDRLRPCRPTLRLSLRNSARLRATS